MPSFFNCFDRVWADKSAHGGGNKQNKKPAAWTYGANVECKRAHSGDFSREKSRVVSLSLYGNAVDKADAPYIHAPSPEIRKVWSQFCTYGTLLRPPRSTSGPGFERHACRRWFGFGRVHRSGKSASPQCHLISNSYLAHLTSIK